MQPTLALFLDQERSYLALVEPAEQYPSVAYINATAGPVQIDGDRIVGEEFLDEVLLEIAGAAEAVAIALPMEYAFFHQFPLPDDADQQVLEELVQLELQERFADYQPEEMEVRTAILAPRLDQRQLVAAVMLERRLKTVLERIAEKAGGKLVYYDIAQNAAHHTLLHNYPEYQTKNAVVIHLQSEYVDITALHNGVPVVYLLWAAKDTMAENLEQIRSGIEEVLSTYLPYIDGIAIFGSALNRPLLSEFQKIVQAISEGTAVFRLNAFRLFTTTLGNRERAYCARTAHLFVPCIGVIVAANKEEQTMVAEQ